MTVPSFRLHTDAFVALLKAIFDEDGVPVGDADATGMKPPYLVVDRGPAMTTGPLDDPAADGHIEYQVGCVGESRQAADGLADAVRGIVLALPTQLTVEARSIPRIEHIQGRGAERTVAGGVEWFTAIEEFRVWTTPRGA